MVCLKRKTRIVVHEVIAGVDKITDLHHTKEGGNNLLKKRLARVFVDQKEIQKLFFLNLARVSAYVFEFMKYELRFISDRRRGVCVRCVYFSKVPATQIYF